MSFDFEFAKCSKHVVVKGVVVVGAMILSSGVLAGTATAQANTVNRYEIACVDQSLAPLPWLTPLDAQPVLSTARQTLLGAYTHGLNPSDYQADELDAQAERLITASRDVATNGNADEFADEIRAFNQRMTRAVACYLDHVNNGVLDPKTLHADIDVPRKNWHAGDALTQAWLRGNAFSLLKSTRPKSPQYQQLRVALAKYRGLADTERDQRFLRLPVSQSLVPGMRHMEITEIRDRLVLLGDLSEADRTAAFEADSRSELAESTQIVDDLLILAPRYDDLTRAAVERFQHRHGLVSDGIIGEQTRRALMTPMYARVAQLEMALERLRWLPDVSNERVIRVNLPEFRLTATESGLDSADLSLDSRVQIGKADRSPTPLYMAEIKHIEFSPYWNVPYRIARDELIPKFRKDLKRMRRMDFEVKAKTGKVYRNATPKLLDMVVQGKARLRQRPGLKNALGRFKFVLPNARGIFLHDTLSQHLFASNQRDFSHGCVRVEEPMALAEMILRDNERWTRQRIEDAVNASKPSWVKPASPVTVMFTYETARVSPDGSVVFLKDVYDYDSQTVASVARWAAMNYDNVNATARNSAEGEKLAKLSRQAVGT
ncbi:MAG: murein L,D-transpeptidase [Burkholderiaceae bacterium]